MNLEDTTLARRTIPPVELPEIVRMIIARMPFEERARARQINRTWNANVTYTVDEKLALFKRAMGKLSFGNDSGVATVARLLQDPRVDPSVDDNIAIRIASEKGHMDVVKRLLQDPRVDPSASRNQAIRFASMSGRAGIVGRLLQDPRVDP